MLLIVGLLGFGLLALLLLNTASAQDAFRLSDLQRQSKALADHEQALTRQAANLSDPANVAAAAARLGMVPGSVPIFLAPGQKVPTGQIIGGMLIVPAPKSAQPAQQPPAPSPKPASTPATKAASKPPTPKTPANKAVAVPPNVREAMQNFYNFQKFTQYLHDHPELAKGPATAGTHP